MDHIFLSDNFVISESYSPHGGRRDLLSPERDRTEHSTRLKRCWRAIWAKYDEDRQMSDATSINNVMANSAKGVYFDFESSAGFEIVANSLENARTGVAISNVSKVESEGGSKDRVTIFVPERSRAEFEKKVSDYAEKDTKKSRKPRNCAFIESIDRLEVSQVESLWTDDPNLMPVPGAASAWCEVWVVEPNGPLLRNASGDSLNVLAFKQVARELQIEVRNKILRFPERSVCLIYASYEQLHLIMNRFGHVGEFRRAKETAEFFMDLNNAEQDEWGRDLLRRVEVARELKVAVAVLDTGVNSHPLLTPVLRECDKSAVDPTWSVTDRDGHGTGMCGLAAYGDLVSPLADSAQIKINHAIESVKILPDAGDNDKDLYGKITQEGMYRAEIAGGARTHIGCMAVTTKEGRDCGKPSSWSAAVDQLTVGMEDGTRRLFFVSAGNVPAEEYQNYPSANVHFSVCDPAQSWNAITVGAFTEKDRLLRDGFEGYTTVAAAGELSPFSATSVLWDGRKWPIKPDIILEGGNLAKSPNGILSEEDGVCLLTTGKDILSSQFQWFNATSAATALAARMAAQICIRYPQAWPETVRGLMIHTAKWPTALKRQFVRLAGIETLEKKSDYRRLLRFAGYGVPDLKRSLDCATNELTLIAQSEIQPFKTESDGNVKCNEIHFYELPWPKEVLQQMGETEVTMRVTLSYFIEPSPGEVGWNDRYKYPSHMLRFDVNNPTEDLSSFKRRLNRQLDDDENTNVGSGGGSERWDIGKNGRKFGSVHSDSIQAKAADLAACNVIGVAPVGGWWKSRPKFKRGDCKTRYSLIVSLETPSTDVDIYTPVYNLIQTSVLVQV